MLNHTCKHRALQGFTLLEILIGLVILSVGVLGLAGLQGASLNSSNTAYFRTVATNQVYDMVERIRSNKLGAIPAVDGGVFDSYNSLSGTPTFLPCNTAVNCDAKDIAVRDIAMWNQENSRVLPNGQGVVFGTGLRSYTITVFWDDEQIGAGFLLDGSGFPVCNPGQANTLKCISITIEPN